MKQEIINFKCDIDVCELVKNNANISTIYYDYLQTPFGECLFAITNNSNNEDRLCYLGFVVKSKDFVLQEAQDTFKNSKFIQDSAKINKFQSTVAESNKLKVLLYGTSFQIPVLIALSKIKIGETCSYQEVASKVGSIKATRAVASAIAKNPISIVIPCHRVIRKSGDINQYHWGVDKKISLLQHEQCLAKR